MRLRVFLAILLGLTATMAFGQTLQDSSFGGDKKPVDSGVLLP